MQTVKKGLEILEVFLKTPKNEISMSDLANSSGLNISTVYRITSLFLKEGYLSQRKRKSGYSLGPKFFVFCSFLKNGMNIGNVAYPFLEKLCKLTDECVHLSVLDGNEAVDTEVIHCNESQRLSIIAYEGYRVPLHCSAVGKVLLAYMTEEERERFFNSGILTSCTDSTITSVEELKKQLLNIKREGVAFDCDEDEVGIRAVASPVKDWDGKVVAAVGVVGPSARITSERMKELATSVKNCALEISRVLGYKGG